MGGGEDGQHIAKVVILITVYCRYCMYEVVNRTGSGILLHEEETHVTGLMITDNDHGRNKIVPSKLPKP